MTFVAAFNFQQPRFEFESNLVYALIVFSSVKDVQTIDDIDTDSAER